MSSSGKTIFFAGMIAAFGVSGISAAADEDMLRVYMDHARVLKLDRPVSKVIVGNAKVADATVADAKTIVLTGRSFGTTNLVLLDADGNAILDERILVSIERATRCASTGRQSAPCCPARRTASSMRSKRPAAPPHPDRPGSDLRPFVKIVVSG